MIVRKTEEHAKNNSKCVYQNYSTLSTKHNYKSNKEEISIIPLKSTKHNFKYHAIPTYPSTYNSFKEAHPKGSRPIIDPLWKQPKRLLFSDPPLPRPPMKSDCW